MISVKIEKLEHEIVVSYADTVLARWLLYEGDDPEYIAFFAKSVLTGLGHVVDEE